MRSATSNPDRLGKLLARREPANVAAEALAILIRDFGAKAGSLYVSRGATLRVRGGELADVLRRLQEAGVGLFRIAPDRWRKSDL